MRPTPALACFFWLLLPGLARAEPWTDANESAIEDRLVDGDLDEEDHVAMRLGGTAGATDVHGQSWVSLVGFTRALRSGKSDIGAALVVGLAFDRVAAGPVHRIEDPPRPLPAPSQAPADPPPQRVGSSLARQCVAAAWRASGLGADDARIDAIVARSRSSALFPETRMRAMRLWNDAARATTLATTDATSYYDSVGANLVLELRLTWHLDRLLFAGDEPTLERVRLERQDARARIATRTLETLFGWQRASIDASGSMAGSHEQMEAGLRAAEAEATLDVLTGGWFSSRSP